MLVERWSARLFNSAIIAAFQAGGASALRKALAAAKPTGSIRIGGASAAPTRFVLDRPTSGGRLLTVITDQPPVSSGEGVPRARPKDDYDFAVIDIEVDAAGKDSGTIAPAARIKTSNGQFVVEDYGAEVVRLNAVTRSK